MRIRKSEVRVEAASRCFSSGITICAFLVVRSLVDKGVGINNLAISLILLSAPNRATLALTGLDIPAQGKALGVWAVRYSRSEGMLHSEDRSSGARSRFEV